MRRIGGKSEADTPRASGQAADVDRVLAWRPTGIFTHLQRIPQRVRPSTVGVECMQSALAGQLCTGEMGWDESRRSDCRAAETDSAGSRHSALDACSDLRPRASVAGSGQTV